MKWDLEVFDFTGGAEGDRTPDLKTASLALSQLSYCPALSKPPCKIQIAAGGVIDIIIIRWVMCQ